MLGIIRTGIQFICDQNCRAEATTYMLSLFAVGWSLGQRFCRAKAATYKIKKGYKLMPRIIPNARNVKKN
jgi:hypothetical protein